MEEPEAEGHAGKRRVHFCSENHKQAFKKEICVECRQPLAAIRIDAGYKVRDGAPRVVFCSAPHADVFMEKQPPCKQCSRPIHFNWVYGVRQAIVYDAIRYCSSHCVMDAIHSGPKVEAEAKNDPDNNHQKLLPIKEEPEEDEDTPLLEL